MGICLVDSRKTFTLLENKKKIRYLSNIEHTSRNRDDIENKCKDAKKGRGVDELGDWIDIYTLLCIKR